MVPSWTVGHQHVPRANESQASARRNASATQAAARQAVMPTFFLSVFRIGVALVRLCQPTHQA